MENNVKMIQKVFDFVKKDNSRLFLHQPQMFMVDMNLKKLK